MDDIFLDASGGLGAQKDSGKCLEHPCYVYTFSFSLTRPHMYGFLKNFYLFI